MASAPYQPPAPGEPLDAVQLALKKLIADLLVAEVLAELAAEADQHHQHNNERQGAAALDDVT